MAGSSDMFCSSSHSLQAPSSAPSVLLSPSPSTFPTISFVSFLLPLPLPLLLSGLPASSSFSSPLQTEHGVRTEVCLDRCSLKVSIYSFLLNYSSS
ncbi:hypothetical protein BDV59DRAFT_77833 [Aspergillus ambiguus]|uniref:uncharacterized protein n=1 Tax=Aspergillus ambiguus TaxID=176160 RepID=UPI003CCD917B